MDEANVGVEKKVSMTHKIRENPWILTTFFFGVLVLVFLIIGFDGFITGKTISGDSAAQQLLTFYQDKGATGLTISSVEEVSGVYKVTFDYNGDLIPQYITKDGKLAGSLMALTTTETTTHTKTAEIPKTDKPVVELYVFTYCPYGLQMEKAMIPVAKLLGNKIDFKIRQIGAMHDPSGCKGDSCFEKTEAERQLCVQKEYPTKLLDYVLAFAQDSSIGSCNGDATCLKPKLSALFTKFGIDENKINSCMTTYGESLYNTEVKNAEAKGVSGSPTVLINGVEAQLARNQDAVKTGICSAFNTLPSECSQTLSTTSAAAGFGTGTTSSGSSATC